MRVCVYILEVTGYSFFYVVITKERQTIDRVMIISSDSVCWVSFTTFYLVTLVKFQAFFAKFWLLVVRITLKIPYSSAFNDFCKQGTRIKICNFFCLPNRFLWHLACGKLRFETLSWHRSASGRKSWFFAQMRYFRGSFGAWNGI